ncbi:hypothetical protein [Tetragenococcus muriaticus]|uniref:hypothetical protein n=1 Tax=Tetragenococcus muriaticus TaxID=64642 RepID=UPI0009E0B53C|nr:hypothetical protein [Tetragenococcus muriaticus]
MLLRPAISSSEEDDQFECGTDIVKIFPAVISTGASFFKQIQGPLGPKKLMAVRGVNLPNAKVFVADGASYLGVGFSFFNEDNVQNLEEKAL